MGTTDALDALDRKILTVLQRDATLPLEAVAREVGSSKTPVWSRIQKLRKSGVIKRQVALLDPDKVGAGACFYVLIRTARHEQAWLDAFLAALKKRPEVVEAHRLAGDIDYILKVRARRGPLRRVLPGADRRREHLQRHLAAVDGGDYRAHRHYGVMEGAHATGLRAPLRRKQTHKGYTSPSVSVKTAPMNSPRIAPALAVVLITVAFVGARMLWLTAAAAPPLHFDEAQYWSYGEALAGGYYSKPPLLPWLIRLSTEIFGDTAFGARAFAPVYHGVVALLIYAIAARLFSAEEQNTRIGLWAAALYLLLPGVSASSIIASTDPPMMVCWAGALYAVIRAAEPKASIGWAALAGALIGLGLLGKYTMAALPASLIGYALFARQGPVRWGSVAVAVIAGIIAAAPNIIWNAQNAFAAVAHVGENANLGGRLFNPGKMLEFVGAQAAIFTPVLAAALVWMLARPAAWRMDPRFRLLLWTCVPLLTLMTVQAFLSRSHPNWAAPAYVSGTIVVVAWLVTRNRTAWLKTAAALGLAAWAGLWGVAQVYAGDRTALPRLYDPFKKTRLYPELCAKASPHFAAENAALIVSNDRRVLANCLFFETLGMDAIATYNPGGGASNHYQLVASLRPGEDRPMIAVALSETAFGDTPARDGWRLLETGEIRTHAGGGKAVRPYWIWAGDRFSDYPVAGENRS